jgi:hypothetical protein
MVSGFSRSFSLEYSHPPTGCRPVGAIFESTVAYAERYHDGATGFADREGCREPTILDPSSLGPIAAFYCTAKNIVGTRKSIRNSLYSVG